MDSYQIVYLFVLGNVRNSLYYLVKCAEYYVLMPYNALEMLRGLVVLACALPKVNIKLPNPHNTSQTQAVFHFFPFSRFYIFQFITIS